MITDCYKYIMDLTTNGVVITDAIKFVQGQMDYLNGQEKKLLQNIQLKRDKALEENDKEQKTYNGIF